MGWRSLQHQCWIPSWKRQLRKSIHGNDDPVQITGRATKRIDHLDHLSSMENKCYDLSTAFTQATLENIADHHESTEPTSWMGGAIPASTRLHCGWKTSMRAAKRRHLIGLHAVSRRQHSTLLHVSVCSTSDVMALMTPDWTAMWIRFLTQAWKSCKGVHHLYTSPLKHPRDIKT